MRCAAIALIVAAFARPFLQQERGRRGRDRRQRARSWSSSISRRAWATAITGSARRTRRATPSRSHRRERHARRSCSSAATPKRTCARRPIAAGSTAAIDAAKVDADCDPLRPGAEARREHPQPLERPRNGSGRSSATSRRRLDRIRRRALPRGHDADAGVGGHARRDQHRRAVGDVRARRRSRVRSASPSPPASRTRANAPVADVPVTLEIDGHQVETQHVTVGANASASVTFAPFTLAEPNVHGIVRAGTDPLPADNVFHFMVSPSRAGVGARGRQRHAGGVRALPVARRSRSARRRRFKSTSCRSRA